MKSVTFLIKPVSSLCNLCCTYCFYHDVAKHRETASMGIMSIDTSSAIIQKACEAVENHGIIQFTFQGGEPTLAGLDFFDAWIQLEQTICPDTIKINHSIQTNGILIDQQWAQFFKAHNFLVGLSIDGPPEFHDAYRINSHQQPTSSHVLNALHLMDMHHVDVNLVSVITKKSVHHPVQTYEYLRSLGNHPLQMITCLDPLDYSQESSLDAEDVGKFLCAVFDLWLEDFKKGYYTSIRLFDDILRMLMGMSPSNCANRGICGGYLTIEADGSLYPCDFYVLDHYRIGYIQDLSVVQAFQHPVYQNFVNQSKARPKHCDACQFFKICRGGCKREWIYHKNPLCKAYTMFYSHTLPYFLNIARNNKSH